MGSAFTAFTSNDHKAIGRMWVGVSLLFLLAIAALAVLAGIERTDPGGIDIFGNLATYFQAWTLVRTGGVFMVAIPLLIGIGTAIVPLQVGARSIAFPRLAAASFWTWLVAAGIHLASFLADGGLGPEAGTDRDGTLLTLVSLAAMIIALLGGVLCIVTTIIALRPEGMGLRDVPMFSWSMLVAGSVWLFSLPILLANLLFAFVDLQGRDPIFFGDADRIWANVEWAFMQPQLFAIAIPVLGIAGDVVPVATGSRLGGRGIIQTGIGLFGAMTFGAWAQHSFSRGADPAFPEGALLYEEFLFGLFSHLALFGAFMAIGGILTPLRNGPKMSAAVLGSVASLLLLLLGLTIGAIRTLNNVIGALLATTYTGEIDAAGARIVADRKLFGLFEVSNDEVFNILHDNNTLLAAWTYGAGRTACFTTDAGHRWATDWTNWNDYDRFFGQLIRWAMRPTGDKGQFNVATQIKNGEGKVIVTAMDGGTVEPVVALLQRMVGPLPKMHPAGNFLAVPQNTWT